MAANGKSALVTGAGRNIGRACVLGLAADGFNVAINGSSDKAACESVAAEARKLGVKALVIMGDVGKPGECKRIAAEAIAAGSRAVYGASTRVPRQPMAAGAECVWVAETMIRSTGIPVRSAARAFASSISGCGIMQVSTTTSASRTGGCPSAPPSSSTIARTRSGS